jgi:hypothetical protein
MVVTMSPQLTFALLVSLLSLLPPVDRSSQSPTVDAVTTKIVSDGLSGFRLAGRPDFVEELRSIPSATQTVLPADFNRDGREG